MLAKSPATVKSLTHRDVCDKCALALQLQNTGPGSNHCYSLLTDFHILGLVTVTEQTPVSATHAIHRESSVTLQ